MPILFSNVALAEDFSWAPTQPGKTAVIATGAEASVQNGALKVGFIGNTLKAQNKWTNTWQTFGAPMVRFVLRDGRVFSVPLEARRVKQTLAWSLRATRSADKRPGLGLVIPFAVKSLNLQGYWRVIMRDDSDYARVEVGLEPMDRDVDVKEIDLLKFDAPGAEVVGRTQGSPVVAGDFFMGIEHPMSVSTVENGVVTCAMRRALPIRNRTTISVSAVVGVAPKGQLRRAFLSYIESERAHPYRPFLHYNSWYDIGYGKPFGEAECLDRINKVGTELVEKRNVQVDSFLFDDGWDNTNSIWEFNSGFPNSFLPLKDAAERFRAAPGVWLSPWGGYGGARNRRLTYGKAHGMELDAQGYALSGPKYYRRFHDVTLDFVTRQGINQFKFDGTGSPDKTTKGSLFDSDFDAAISLIGDLRKARPDLFINLTTGTWPSPFWLRYADSTWRGGADNSLAGVGSQRQRYITYRDGDTYHGVVQRGPLYPLNSLMVHGVIYANHDITTDPNNEFVSDLRDFFGNGTQLQELYITPDKLSPQNWDDLAEAAKWSRQNADVLKDVHWVGGDPVKLEVYGWASWSPRMGILVLRNPSDKPQAFSVDIASVLELPGGFAKSYAGRSPWKADSGQAAVEFPVGQSVVVDLKPFEVRVLNLEPRK
ncbi:MAG: enterotoxin [Fimbriimonadales bacterium]